MERMGALVLGLTIAGCGTTDDGTGNTTGNGSSGRTATVSIVGPAMACVGDPASFRASTVVSDRGAVITEWFVEGRASGSGEMFETTFDEPGVPRIFVEVSDESGVLANDALDFEVVSCGGGTPPMITDVTWPTSDIQSLDDEDFTYAWTGAAMGRPGDFVRAVMPMATVMDAEDGPLTGEALRWTTDQTMVQDALLGTGSNPELSFFGDCFGQTHTVTLTATDSDDEVATRSFVITFYTLCLQ